jgi:hypothetical protein
MRAIVLVLVAGLAGCLDLNPFPPGDPGDIVNPGDPGGFPSVGCHSDADCTGGNVCARVGGCAAPASIRAVHISWTVNGKPASTAACDTRQSLEIDFLTDDGSNAHVGYAPVPCAEGKFTIDKLPTYYGSVSLGERWTPSQSTMIDAVTGEAALDLTF